MVDKMDKKYLIIIDAVVLLGSLLTIFLLLDYSQPLVIAPLSSEQADLLIIIHSKDYIILDDSSKFDSPQTIFIDDYISLESGIYFIKFSNNGKSDIRQIEFELDVKLQLRKLDDSNLGIFNIGESDLKIDTYEIGSLIDTSIASSGGNNE